MRGMFGDRDIPVADDRDVAQNPRADRHALAPAPLRLVVAAVERQQDEFAARQSLLLAAANQPRYVLGEAREELARLFEANDGRQAVKARGIERRSDLSLPLWIQKIVQAPQQILFCKQLLVVRDSDIARRLAQQPPVHLHHRRRDVGKRLAPGKTGSASERVISTKWDSEPRKRSLADFCPALNSSAMRRARSGIAGPGTNLILTASPYFRLKPFSSAFCASASPHVPPPPNRVNSFSVLAAWTSFESGFCADSAA